MPRKKSFQHEKKEEISIAAFFVCVKPSVAALGAIWPEYRPTPRRTAATGEPPVPRKMATPNRWASSSNDQIIDQPGRADSRGHRQNRRALNDFHVLQGNRIDGGHIVD